MRLNKEQRHVLEALMDGEMLVTTLYPTIYSEIDPVEAGEGYIDLDGLSWAMVSDLYFERLIELCDTDADEFGASVYYHKIGNRDKVKEALEKQEADASQNEYTVKPTN